MDEERLIEIESKLAHQEHLVLELNRIVADQQQQIARLEQRCQSLLERIRSLSEDAPGGGDGDERPPHY
jgi:SlyX protein